MSEEPLSPAVRRAIVALVVAQGVLFAVLGFARYATFHNTTFDLAFYTRISFGLARYEFWEPMVNAHVFGLHISPILVPLGVLGWVFDTAAVLLVAQAAALACSAFPLARIGARHLGPAGAIAGALVFLFYPNLGHVAGDEFHPGSLAVLPLAWTAYAIDRGDARVFVYGTVGVLLCREDLALVTALACVLFALRYPEKRRAAVIVGASSTVYVLVFLLVIHPIFAPEQGSLELHFGRFGSTPVEVAFHLITHPIDLVVHLATVERLTYLPKILAPLAFLSLLRPRWLIPALPIVAINLVSEWPTATDLSVHYLTPAVPFLVAAALDGAGRIAGRAPVIALVAIVGSTLVAHLIAGGTPLSLDYPGQAYRPDRNTAPARAIVSAIPEDVSVQAPDPLLAHVAERLVLHRIASPEFGDDYVVLDVWHRRDYAGDEDLLRTHEEPFVRTFFARDDHRVVMATGDYVLLERGHSPREGLGGRAIVGRADPGEGERIASCLAVLEAEWTSEDVLAIDLVARDSCPNDLAIRLGTGERPERVDLLFGGLLSPAHIARGDRVRSRHRFRPEERARIEQQGLRVGALRSSGARPEPEDPTAVDVDVR